MTSQPPTSWLTEVEVLKTAPLSRLVARYEALFGEQPRSRNRTSILRRVAWRLQANLYGNLTERARRRATEIVDERDFRLTSPPANAAPSLPLPPNLDGRDSRLPFPGTVLVKTYRGRKIAVKVLLEGFEYDGAKYTSLSAVAERVTGTRWNGFLFFGLQARKRGQ